MVLRAVADEDIPVFFDLQFEEGARAMISYAGEPAQDHDVFGAKWDKIRSDDSVVARTIAVDDRVAGYITSFIRFDVREVGYWLAREFWGRGLATAALREFLALELRRPLAARVSKHNAGSLRVVQKCGFAVTGDDRWTPPYPGAPEIAEWVLRLD